MLEKTPKFKDFMIVARIESLILDKGINDAKKELKNI